MQLDMASAQDEKLVSGWIDWMVAQEIIATQNKCQNLNDREDCESQRKRQRSSGDALQPCIAS